MVTTTSSPPKKSEASNPYTPNHLIYVPGLLESIIREIHARYPATMAADDRFKIGIDAACHVIQSVADSYKEPI